MVSQPLSLGAKVIGQLQYFFLGDIFDCFKGLLNQLKLILLQLLCLLFQLNFLMPALDLENFNTSARYKL